MRLCLLLKVNKTEPFDGAQTPDWPNNKSLIETSFLYFTFMEANIQKLVTFSYELYTV